MQNPKQYSNKLFQYVYQEEYSNFTMLLQVVGETGTKQGFSSTVSSLHFNSFTILLYLTKKKRTIFHEKIFYCKATPIQYSKALFQ